MSSHMCTYPEYFAQISQVHYEIIGYWSPRRPLKGRKIVTSVEHIKDFRRAVPGGLMRCSL